MSSPFLSGGTTNISAILTSGTQPLNVATIVDQSLIPNLPVCTDGDKKLVSRQLGTADLNFAPITNPFAGVLTTNAYTMVQQAAMASPPAGSNTLWALDSDGRTYITDSDGKQNRIAYSSDGISGDTISNGTGQSITVNVNGSIAYVGGCVQSISTAIGPGVYTALVTQTNIIVDDATITEVSLPVSPTGTVYYVRREYALQMGEVWPASVFIVSAVGSTIEDQASVNITAYSGSRFLFIGTKWVIC